MDNKQHWENQRLSTESNIGGSLLSKPEILRHLSKGNIVIYPLVPERIQTVSVDVTLGKNYYRPSRNYLRIYNPWSRCDVEEYWGQPQLAKLASEIFDGDLPDTLNPNDRVIILQPNELLLCHTEEFIGGQNNVTTMMKARSSMGRSGITVCKCAGWGDIGYVNRWTMEVQNTLTVPNLLIVGERVAQIAFFEVAPIEDGSYGTTGKYQTSNNIEEIIKNWKPEAMLPKLWKDRM